MSSVWLVFDDFQDSPGLYKPRRVGRAEPVNCLSVLTLHLFGGCATPYCDGRWQQSRTELLDYPVTTSAWTKDILFVLLQVLGNNGPNEFSFPQLLQTVNMAREVSSSSHLPSMYSADCISMCTQHDVRWMSIMGVSSANFRVWQYLRTLFVLSICS